MLSKQAHIVWINEAGGRPVILRPGLHAVQQAALHYVCQPCWTPGGRRSAREDNDRPPLHRNSTARSRCGCPGRSSDQTWEPQEHSHPMTMLHAPHKARATILEGEQLQILPHPPYSPDVVPCDFGLFSAFKTGFAGKKILRKMFWGRICLKDLGPDRFCVRSVQDFSLSVVCVCGAKHRTE